MLKDFELYNVHAKGAEIEKWPILNTKIDYAEYSRKKLPLNRVKFSSAEGKCEKGCRNLQMKFKHVNR